VKAWSLRRAYVGATVITLAALASAEPTRAHVDVRPRLVEQGAVVDLVVELPRLVAGRELVRLELEGEGVEVLSTRPSGSAGMDALWSARLRVDAPPGRLVLRLRPGYAGGRSAEFEQALTVVPPEESPFPWAAAAGGAVVALGAAAAALVVTRRRA
jgi:hypothetical protein